ncbi:hypothetical protein DVH05_016919 [Phytophthora capsici]|nr:hypothetical protein DVH05_016919 [Phytophthora capsici]|eukprot:jgi/Phyca11/12665/fgenesh1_pg.PHYCAscaffold_1_\
MPRPPASEKQSKTAVESLCSLKEWAEVGTHRAVYLEESTAGKSMAHSSDITTLAGHASMAHSLGQNNVSESVDVAVQALHRYDESGDEENGGRLVEDVGIVKVILLQFVRKLDFQMGFQNWPKLLMGLRQVS